MQHTKAIKAYQVIANLIITAKLEPEDTEAALSYLEEKHPVRLFDYLHTNHQFNNERAA